MQSILLFRPRFFPFAKPIQGARRSPSTLIPHFEGYHPPIPISITPDEIAKPEFTAFIPPKKRLGKEPRAPEVRGEANPVMGQFRRLLKFYSYEDILNEALRLDSLGDLRMLRKRTLLQDRHVGCLLEFLERETPWLLPKSDHFQIYIENDQAELNLFADFCRHLLTVKKLNEINFQPHTLIDRLVPKGVVHEQKILLQVKDWIYCFFSEILEEERRKVKEFNALKKDLNPLAEALIALAAHIQKDSEDLRMQLIRDAAQTPFHPWEDRTPLLRDVARLDPGEFPDGYDLEKGLKDIRGKDVKAFQLSDFTNKVVSLPEGNAAEALKKGKYFFQLAKVYFKLNTIPSLKRAIGWVDQALETIVRHVGADNQHYLKFYEYRGVIQYQMAQLVKPISKVEDTLVRKRVDLASRDFHHSEHVPVHRKTNFVKIAQTDLDEAIKLDDDFAQGRFALFLKHYEKSKLDTSLLLHPQFSSLKRSSIDDVLKDFRKLLAQEGDLETSVFKVTLPSSKIFLRFTPEGLALSRGGSDVLIELLSKGVKHVKAVHLPQNKPYFAPALPANTIRETVQSLGDYSKRLGEMEKEIQNFRSFELASLYKSSFRLDKEVLETKAVPGRLKFDLVSRVMELKVMIAQGYRHLGKTTPSTECYATALLYTCQALEDCELLKKDPFHQKEMGVKKMDLLLQRAAIYKSLKLWKCYAESLEEIIAYGKKAHQHFLSPSLHYALGRAYMELNRFEDAEDQFYIVQSSEKKRNVTETLKRKHEEKNRKITEPFLSSKNGRCFAKKAGFRLKEIEDLKTDQKRSTYFGNTRRKSGRRVPTHQYPRGVFANPKSQCESECTG